MELGRTASHYDKCEKGRALFTCLLLLALELVCQLSCTTTSFFVLSVVDVVVVAVFFFILLTQVQQ